MKKLFILIFAVALIACSDEKIEKTLNEAEETVNSCPDSAMTILNRIIPEEGKLAKRQKMKYLLLRTIAMDKCDIRLDTVLYMNEVAEYYNKKDDRHNSMKAYYMAGGVYRDRGNAPKALEYYRKAVTVADTTKAGCDFKTLSRIYGQIATLFHMQLSPDLELEAEWKAVRYAEMAGDSIGAIIFYENLRNAYYLKRDYDAMARIGNEVYMRYKTLGKSKLAASSLSPTITIYLKKGLYSKAKTAMDEFESCSEIFNDKGNIIKSREIYYANKGIYYEGIGKNDSALYFYRKLLSNTSHINNIEAGYKGLMSVYQKLGIADSAVKYSRLFALINDSSAILRSSENIIKMQALYDYTDSQQIAETKTEEADRYRYVTFIIIITAMLMGYYIYRYIKKRNQKNREEIATANDKYSKLLYQYNNSKKEMNLLKSGLDSYRESKETEVSNLRQAIELLRKEQELPEICDTEQALLECAIVRRLHKHAAKLTITASSEWEELYIITKEHLKDFYSKITDPQNGLTTKETNVCILTKLKFSPNEIAVLTDMSKQRISNIRSSINKKLFNEEGTRTLDRNIGKL